MVILAMCLTHFWINHPSEPFYNNDETRHLMTGVFFRDLFKDMPLLHLHQYTVDYYLQYPALGLLVWPPLFYMIEGLFMLVFGASFLIAKLLILTFACLTLYFLFMLVRRTHDLFTATLACLFLAFSPLFFLFSHRVMLEMPTLAFSWGAIYYFYCYLQEDKSRHLYFASIACTLAMLSRFDALFLFPAFFFMAVMRRQSFVLIRKKVLFALLFSLAIAAPAYAATAVEFGRSHLHSISSNTGTDSTHFLALKNFLFYPSVLASQMGWPLTLFAVLGFGLLFLPSARKTLLPFVAMALATYITFTPMAELESRHAIYWVPAMALFAATAISTLLKNRSLLLCYGVAGLCLAGTAFGSLNKKSGYVRGYEEAAMYVLEHTQASRYCLFDNYLNGNFIFQIRMHDPERRLGVLRGDKLFYAVLSDPRAGYKEFAHGKEDIISGIFKYDPEYIVVEDPQINFNLPSAALLRSVLRDSTERFHLEKTVPIRSNLKSYEGISLLIYRNTLRNPNPSQLEVLEMIGLGHQINASRPEGHKVERTPSLQPTPDQPGPPHP